MGVLQTMEQRTILFRGKRLDNNEWVYGGYFKHDTVKVCFTSDNPETKHCIVFDGFCDWGFEPPVQYCEVDPETVCQYTGMNEFVVTDPSVHAPIFENDIVEFWVTRRLPGEGCKSQYDGDCKIRATVVFKYGEFMLDLDNTYNNNVSAAKGNEKYDRDFTTIMSFYNFRCQHSNNLDAYRARNKNYKFGDIVRLGNIHDNPELLEV